MATRNGSIRLRRANEILPDLSNGTTNAGKNDAALTTDTKAEDTANTTYLLICVGGIYASFLTWGVLQERITTTNYGTESSPEIFKYPVVMNTVQSLFAAILGYIYVLYLRKTPQDLPVYPSRKIIWPLSLVAITSSLASPFGYASLQHVDYITFILAKSCKLLPVMFLHVTLYRKRYPFYKYAVVALVTAGVAVFTLHSGSGTKKKGNASGSSVYGLMLLGVNLLFDGLTNSTQDDIYASFRPYTGQQMMCALNVMSTFLTSAFLLVSPYLMQSGMGATIGIDVKGSGELQEALAFAQRHPAVGWDILGFAACGAMGQVFIFMTLSIFGSLFLVTVTVTRKMLTMILSVVWFGHALSAMQWLGVGLVFGGVGIEAQLSKQEKQRKMQEKKVKA
ncbi:hypothetical protein DOTSEDRAFT_68681 [Dothistroma septosporum NZE10]|uniref:UDP-galactose transporter homolog 1 n=1 Tax=Dothistroma septosporum (strain NZE10 / CBS 128990) TaxID=675120 RepID=N1Q2F8_DOTSN|nr:hypothetical protein DOTSEDRAFT_68681 [Dothistroma septosporum NZE10]